MKEFNIKFEDGLSSTFSKRVTPKSPEKVPN